MPRPRKQIVNLDATPYYHCVARCVRQAWLCGEDAVTGRNFDHRKTWLSERIHQLSQTFAIDVCAYALMSNHYHLVVRIDANRAERWNESEVVRRYSRLHRHAATKFRHSVGSVRTALVQTWRDRLSSLSWMMSALNEWLARKANKEEGRTGRFWEGRFYSQPLLGLTGLLTCMAYVDLNPLRAGVAETLEESDFTSIQRRLIAAAREARTASRRDRKKAADGGLAPMRVSSRRSKELASEPIPISLTDYVALLIWIEERRRNASCESAQPQVLSRMRINGERWSRFLMETRVERCGALGQIDDIRAYAKATGARWIRGIGQASHLVDKEMTAR